MHLGNLTYCNHFGFTRRKRYAMLHAAVSLDYTPLPIDHTSADRSLLLCIGTSPRRIRNTSDAVIEWNGSAVGWVLLIQMSN